MSDQDALAQPPLNLDECTKFSYTYAFPLLVMKATYDQQTAIVPDGQFNHHQTLSTPDDRTVVLPNIDTLYSRAWLIELSKYPVVLTIPEVKLPNGKDRYFLFPIIDAFTNVVASPGLRTKDKYPYPGRFVIVGPGYKGIIPPEFQRIDIASDIAWIFGRIQTFGEADIPNVQKIQQGFTLARLITGFQDHVNLRSSVPPAQVVMGMDYIEFFKRFADLWAENPPLPADIPYLPMLARLNLVPGKPWDPSSLPPSDLPIIEKAYHVARAQLPTSAFPYLDLRNYWSVNPDYVARWGTNYIVRAFIGLVGIGINLIEDSIFPQCTRDKTGTNFDASSNYKLELDILPPVNGFWSVTIYDRDGFLIRNDDKIYAVGDSFNDIQPGPVVIWIQRAKPSLAPNHFWLPAPPPIPNSNADSFQLILRLYWPKDAAMNGKWWINGVEKL